MPVTRPTLHREQSLDRDMHVESGHFHCQDRFPTVPKLSEGEDLEDHDARERIAYRGVQGERRKDGKRRLDFRFKY